jgi:tetratricopeptide (TPR) repeat protein
MASMRRCTALGLLLLLGIVAGCSRDPGEAGSLRELVPGLDPELGSLLERDDVRGLHEYLERTNDRSGFFNAPLQIINLIDTSSLESYRASRARFGPMFRRLAVLHASEFGERGLLAFVDELDAMAPADGLHWLRLDKRAETYRRDPELDLETKYLRIQALADTLATLDQRTGSLSVESRLMEIAADLGLERRKQLHRRRALALSREIGADGWTAQLLGTLCYDLLEAGRVDTAQAVAREATTIASESCIPNQAGRVESILAVYYSRIGRLSLASEYFEEAYAAARRCRVGYFELRYLLSKLFFYARLGCWELVGREIPRIQVILAEMVSSSWHDGSEAFRVNAWRLMANYHLERGEIARADSLFAAAAELARAEPRNYMYAAVLLVWSREFVRHGEVERGLELALRGLDYVRDEHIARHEPRFLRILVQGELARGRREAAESWFHELSAVNDSADAPDGRITDLLLRMGLCEAAGDRRGAREALTVAVSHHLRDLTSWGPGVASYLKLDRRDELRAALHRHFVTTPEDGLAVELAWRAQLRRWMVANRWQTAVAPGEGLQSLLDCGHDAVRDLIAWCSTRAAVALVYGHLDARLLRWTVAGGAVRCDTLAVPVPDIRGDVEAVLPRLRTLPARETPFPPADLYRQLAELSRRLLPDACWRDDGGPLLIAPAASLQHLPFAACNLDTTGGYLPLARRWRVANLRSLRCEPDTQRATGPACIVGAPTLDERIRRRYPGLNPIPHALSEARRAAASFASCRLLVGDDATKPALVTAWEGAPVVYFASHLFRDPDLPYRSFIPLAPSPGQADPAFTYLGFHDVLAADLRGCELVVLSNCSSGVGHQGDVAVAPSLADAFIDAGASGVIHTHWPVDDSSAETIMRRFVENWQGTDLDSAWSALDACRREFMQQEGRYRHPALWAGYALTLGRLP